MRRGQWRVLVLGMDVPLVHGESVLDETADVLDPASARHTFTGSEKDRMRTLFRILVEAASRSKSSFLQDTEWHDCLLSRAIMLVHVGYLAERYCARWLGAGDVSEQRVRP